LHGYLDLFLFYLMIHNGSGYVDWVVWLVSNEFEMTWS
jgi:hypothetical protein